MTSKTILDRFHEKYLAVPEAGCWLWMAGWHPQTGYGRFGMYGREVEYSHRASWRLLVGPIPEGMEVCHKCDVRLCVNPNHLFVGTRKDNMQDCSKKGRLVMPKKNWHSSGSHQVAKLTDEQVIGMRASSRSHASFAEEYGVVPATIWRARTKRSFKDVP